jgi:hypothetical protein
MPVRKIALSIVLFLLSPGVSSATSKPGARGQDAQQPKAEAKASQDKGSSSSEKEMEAKACGLVEVNFDHKSVSSPPPNLAAPPDKALIFVVRPAFVGKLIQTKLAADGNWIGTNKGKGYFSFTLEPGEHYLCSKAENRSVLKLTVEAGKTYFVQQKIEMGLMKARNKIVQLSDEEGRKALEKCDLSLSEPKK